MDVRDFLFRNRSYTPIPLAVIILYFAHKGGTAWFPGVLLVIFGELLRLASVRHAGGGTRTRKVGARKLCTTGPFAHVRNPIYLGNMMICCGAVLIAGGGKILIMLVITASFFALQYGLIISREEQALAKLFGPAYEEYKGGVPRLLPRFRRRKKEPGSTPLPWLKAVKMDKRTIQTILGFLAVLVIRVYLFS